MSLRPLRRTAALIAAAALIGASAADAAPKAGETYTIAVAGKSGPVTIRLHYCPAGQLRPGPPPAEGAPPASPVAMTPFYASETEVTIQQFRDLLGIERAREVAGRTRPDFEASKKLLERLPGAGQAPMSLVMLDDAVEFCNALQTLAGGSDPGSSGIAATLIRLPTHEEWQYACRARVDPSQLPLLPFFSGWPDGVDSLDKNIRGKCEEEWSKMNKGGVEFLGSQEQAAEILDARQSSTNPIPLEILTAFLKQGIGTKRNYAITIPDKLTDVPASKSNAWGLYDMHDGVREWAIAAGHDAIDALWKGLAGGSTAPANARFVLAGGSYNETMEGVGSWRKFTIWGGAPWDSQRREVKPFPATEAKDITIENEPGIRLVMRRRLADDWLFAVREDWALGRAKPEEALAKLNAKRALAAELAEAPEAAGVAAKFAFYEALINYRAGKVREAHDRIAAVRKDLSAGPTKAKGTSDDALRAAFARAGLASNCDQSGRQEADDPLYFDLLVAMMAQDR